MATGVTSSGYEQAEKIRNEALRDAANTRKIVAAALALLNALLLISNFKKQKALADRTYKISLELHNKLKDKFWPRELQFLNEFGYDGGEDIEDIDDYGKRYGGRLRATVAKTYSDKLKQLRCQAPRYCVSQIQRVYQELFQQKAFALANANIAGQGIGFNEYQQRVSKARNRRLQAIGLGEGLTGMSLNATKTAAGALAASGADYANNLKVALGQWSTAEYTRYRYDHADLIARAGGSWEDLNDIRDLQDRIETNRGNSYAVTAQRASMIAPNYSSGLGDNGFGYAYAQNQGWLSDNSTYTLKQTSDWNIQNNTTDLNYGASYHAPNAWQQSRVDLYQNRMQVYNYATHDTMNTASSHGHDDTVRNGSHYYELEGFGWGGITVNMSDFPIADADNNRVGDTQVGMGGI